MFNDPNSIKSCIDTIAKYGKYVNDSNTNYLATLVQAMSVLQHKRPRLMNDANSLKLLDSIVDCLSSQTYIQQLHFTFLSDIANNYFKDYKHFQLVEETSTNCGTSLLLNACPSYFTAYRGEHRQEISYRLTERMLDQYEQILDKFVPFLANCTDKVIYPLHHLMIILVSISNVDSCRVKFNEKPDLISSLLRISNAPNLCNSIQSTDDNPSKLLMNSTLTLLYNLTCETKILQLLKSIENTAKTFLHLIKIACYAPRIRLQALQIVAVILNSDDIKNLDSTQFNPSGITSELLKFSQEAIKSSSQRYLGVHVYSLLCNLRALLQHDKMQDEFFKQKGVELVLSCRMKFGDLYLSLVLEILVTMTFHKEAGELLKKDKRFIQDLETYMKSDDESVQKNAKAIQWSLIGSENKDKDINKDAIQYQIMISYAHAQKEIANKLLQQLRKDGFSVWIDSMRSNDDNYQSVADVVQNSEIVLICMSTEYNYSSACRVECRYAFHCRRKIIPIKVEQKFRFDGWLGLLVADLMYVDFSKEDFNDNYKRLNEVIMKQFKQT